MSLKVFLGAKHLAALVAGVGRLGLPVRLLVRIEVVLVGEAGAALVTAVANPLVLGEDVVAQHILGLGLELAFVAVESQPDMLDVNVVLQLVPGRHEGAKMALNPGLTITTSKLSLVHSIFVRLESLWSCTFVFTLSTLIP